MQFKNKYIIILDSTNASYGLQIALSTGEVCNDGNFYTVKFNISCDPTMERGKLEFWNQDEFSLSKCENILIGRSIESKIIYLQKNIKFIFFISSLFL
jgi:hypothetical protein